MMWNDANVTQNGSLSSIEKNTEYGKNKHRETGPSRVTDLGFAQLEPYPPYPIGAGMATVAR
jgi:hypothetical protein